MRFIKMFLLAAVLVGGSSCDVKKRAEGAYNMVKCEYEYNSISNVTLSGMNFSNGVSPFMVPKVMAIMTGRDKVVPISFDLNINITNPNQTEAILGGMDYILNIDGTDFFASSLTKHMNIAPGETDVLPIMMAFNIGTLLSGDSRETISNAVLNILGMGDHPSKITLRIRPYFYVAGRSLPSLLYIPIGFTIG